MPISDKSIFENTYLFVPYRKYEYKFGDLDLFNSCGIMGSSILNFGLFYTEIDMYKDKSNYISDPEKDHNE